ncbi:pilus assembly protein [Marinicella gelatinilytica]|uniref:pilus assembly protein n=1 Tax=Marinicella gelatinilytica TaxID=2996017 RepID=UPI002260C77F|nr:PilC/PilY family type IV pilus protein [Marinicella gelatinilytica]MCX7544581.1 PilC/PilY family type IV pilus protein [Marinicella gelatinilytica]
MNKLKSFAIFTVFMVSMGAGITPAKSALLQLSHDPLFLNQTVPPAIAVTLDDSGSMAWGYLYVANRSDWNQHADPNFNRLYYNPNITYSPPIKADGSQMPNIDYTAAPTNGYSDYGTYGTGAVKNLTNNYTPYSQLTYNSNGTFGASWAGEMDAASNDGRETRAFYLKLKTDGTYEEVQLTAVDDLNNFANWYSYYNTRMKLARASISRAFAGFGPSFKIDWQNLHEDTTLNNLTKFENTHRENFYDWLFSSPTSGGTPLRSSFRRAGELFKDEDSYDSDDYNTELSCQQNFHIAISDGEWNGGVSNPAEFFNDNSGTASSLPGDSESKYGNYDGANEQTIYPYNGDSNNLADVAFHYWATDLVPDLDNNVKRYKKSFTDASGTNITVPNGGDEWDVPAFVWNPKNNPAYWQHLVTYNVGMGLETPKVLAQMAGGAACVTNSLSDPKEAVYRALRTGDCSWSSNKIEDVWHSSINSRGDFFSANDPEELITALNDVVNDILERLSRGSTSTVSSGVITNDTLAFSPRFDSSIWAGNILARQVNPDGTFSDPLWDAACILTGGLCSATGEHVSKQLTRNIFTYDKNTGTVPFNTSLNAGLKSQLQTNATDLINRTGVSVNDIIEYVTGNQDKEISNGGVLRNRSSVLADVIHGSPSVVTGPSGLYDDNMWPAGTPEASAFANDEGYLHYQEDQLNRHNVMYVGSNSGMLHAFDAEDPTTTEEYWGYIPSKAFDNIHRLADPQFKHWSYVDNTPVVADAYFNTKWRTTLVGSMRYGGQAYFALDVTNAPSSAPEVLWEFTDEDDPDLGYSYGHATIVRIGSTGDWVALIPNGYNNTQTYTEDLSDPNDNHVSATGHAVLFVVRMSDGQLLAKLDTGVGTEDTPNGLSPAIAVDSEFSFITGSTTERGVDVGADYAYAGDLYGNLWRFDFSSDNYSDWSSNITRVVEADNIMEQPITIQPRVVKIPNAYQTDAIDVMVMFGTGKYIEVPDRSINLPDDQYLVGVIDGLGSSRTDMKIDDSEFIDQTLMPDGPVARDLTANTVDLTTDYGWKVKLPDEGERLANPMTLLGNKVLLAATTVTAGIDPCQAGGRSWLNALNPYTGGIPEIGRVFNNPLGTYLGGDDSIFMNDLIIGKPPILEMPGLQKIIIEGAEGTEIVTIQSYTWRRRNWTNLLTE